MAKHPKKYEDTAIGKMEDAFYHFNIKDEGKDHGRATDSQWWRKDVRFYAGTPVTRYMGREPLSHTPVFICGEGYIKPDEKMIGLWYAKAVPVPDAALGVFSQFEGDCIDIGQTHERVRFLMLSIIRKFVMVSMPDILATKLTPPSRNDAHWQTNRNWQARQGVGSLRDWLLGRIGAYRDYSATFGLNWPDVPPMYRDQFEAVTDSKLKRYLHPKAVTQRERAAARKLAIAALEIEVAKGKKKA